MNQFFLKKGDTYKSITTELEDKTGIVNLELCTVKFQMRKLGAATNKVDATATVLNQTTNRGQVRYDWIAGDVDTEGEYQAEWEVTFSGGHKRNFPTRGDGKRTYNYVIIQPNL